MKKKRKLCSFLLSIICLLQGMTVCAGGTDILSWTVTSNDETAVVELARDTVRNGNAALYVSTEQTEGNQNGQTTKIYQKASGLEPSTSYRFSFWCKAEHINKYTVVRDIFNSVDAKADESGTYDWTEKSIDFTTTKSATTAAFQFIIAYGDGNKGEVWIDDVSLYKLSDDEPTGENLILNGDFEEGIDAIPPEAVNDASVTSGDGCLAVSWKDPSSSDLKGINIFVDDVFYDFVNAGEEYYIIENLENGQEYTITLEAEDLSGNKADGIIVYGSPKGESAVPDVYADDINDLIVGIDEEMEYSVDGGDWIAYTDSTQPKLSGSHLVKVRYRETESTTAGKHKVILFFKADKEAEGDMKFSASIKVDEVTVKGTALAGSRVRIVARLADNPDTIVFIKEIDADDSGSFTQKFYMPYTAPAGHYLLKCKSDNTAEAEPKEVIYTDREALGDLTDRLKSSSEIEIQEILSSEQDADKLSSLGIDMNGLSQLSSGNKANIAKAVYSKRSEISENNLDAIINSQIAVGLIQQSNNSGEVLEVLIAYQPWLNLSMENVPFDSVTDNELIAWICEKIYGKGFKDCEEVAEYYQKQCAFYVLNSESYVNLGTVMEKYKSELEIEDNSVYNSYSELSEREQETVNRKVKLANSSYDDTDKLVTAIKNAMNSSSSSNNSGGGGGSSSGGGGGIGPKLPVVVPDTSEVKNTQTEVQPETKKIFNDLDSVPWAEAEINALAEKGILSGIEDGVFAPNSLVTREQLAVMIFNAFKISSANEDDNPFTDVDKERWSYQQIKALKQNGLINGYDDGSFLPQNPVSREDMVLILYRTLKQESGLTDKIREIADFTDWEDVSDYAKDGVREMYCMGFVNGVGNGEFAPKGTATRAMAAKVLHDIVIGIEN